MHKTKITIFFAIISIALFGGARVASAAPEVLGITGDLNNKATVMVEGSGFGTKVVATPWVWDNFEDGTNANLVGTSPKGIWQQYYSTGSVFPHYDSSAAYSGFLGTKKTTQQSEEFYSYGVSGLNSDEMYYSIMFKWTKDVINDSGANPVMKMTRLNTQGSFYTSQPSIYTTVRTGSGWSYGDATNGTGALYNEPFLGYLTPDIWHRIEVYWKLSMPGIADGEVKFFFDNIEKQAGLWSNVITRAISYPNQKVDNFLLPMMQSLGSTNIYSFHADDVYVDRTQARVEVCNTATWSARTHCEIQIPSAWLDTSATVILNQGIFADFNNTYLYVIDADGNVNANGYLLTSADTISPSAPSGLVVS